jgi:CPA1 family monovalent cation:H+ antiporter
MAPVPPVLLSPAFLEPYSEYMDILIGKTIGLLVVAILVAIAARRLRLPYTVGLVVAGMSLAISHVDLGIALTRDIIFDVILPPLLFEAALNLRWSEIQRDAAPILLLSIVGVLISAGITYLGMTRLLGWPTAPALIFSILIAATDPVAVIALFKDLGIEGRTRLLVESESLFNDGVAAVLFALALTWISGSPSGAGLSWRLLITMSGGGLLTGALVGIGALLVAGRTGDHLVETAVTVAASYGAFLLAENFHFSGVLATVTAGLIIGAVGVRATGRRLGLSRQGRVFAIEFWEFLAFIANSVVFLLIGVSVSRIQINALGYMPLIATVLLVLVSRAASVYPLSLVFRSSRWKISLAEQHVLFWAGLRGALGLALALSLPDALPMRGSVIIATFVVVTFSVVVQGLTMPTLLRSVTPPSGLHS